MLLSYKTVFLYLALGAFLLLVSMQQSEEEFTIGWQMAAPYYNPLHISIFNFLGWHNVGMLDVNLNSARTIVTPITCQSRGIDLLVKSTLSKKSFLEKAQESGRPITEETVKEFFKSYTPSLDNPWYLILPVTVDTKLISFREQLLSNLSLESLQKRFHYIPKFEELNNNQSPWNIHITLGRITHIDDMDAFAHAFIAALDSTQRAITVDIQASHIALSTRDTGKGKKGKLLSIQLNEQEHPELYERFRTIQKIIKNGSQASAHKKQLERINTLFSEAIQALNTLYVSMRVNI